MITSPELCSINKLYGDTICASDPKIGRGDERPAFVSKAIRPHFMDSSVTEPRKRSVPVFNVAILYESSEAGLVAKQFSDQLATGVAANRILNLEQWDFRFLGRRAIRNAAASAAASADIVILSMSGINPLPTKVERWIEMWTWLIDGSKPAVVALFASHHPENSRIRSHLRRAAASKGLTFFPETACGMADGGRAGMVSGSDQISGANRQQMRQTVQ